MPGQAKRPGQPSKPVSKSYTPLPSLRQVRFTPQRTAVEKRPPKSQARSRQSTLTQTEFIRPVEVLDSDEENLLEDEEDGRTLKQWQNTKTTVTTDEAEEVNSLSSALRASKRKRDGELDDDTRARRRQKKDPQTLSTFAKDKAEEDCTSSLRARRRDRGGSILNSQLSTPQPRERANATASTSKIFKTSSFPPPRTPQKSRPQVIRSSESPETSPELPQRPTTAPQLKDRSRILLPPRSERRPLGTLSSNVSGNKSHLIKQEHQVKEEPLTQPVTGLELPPAPATVYEDDDLDAQPAPNSPSQGNANRIPSDIPWHIPSTPTQAASDPLDPPSVPGEVGIAKEGHSPWHTIADSESEGEEGLETQHALPGPDAAPPQPHQHRALSSEPDAVPSDATTRPPSSGSPRPAYQETTPRADRQKSFSQATTVDMTPRSQRTQLGPKPEQGARTQHPLSDQLVVPSSSPIDTPPRKVYKNVPGFGDVDVLTHSQMLPDSIMNFELPVQADDESELSQQWG